MCTHTSIHKHAHKRHSTICLRVYDWDLKQCSFLSKHLIIPAGWQRAGKRQSLSLSYLEKVMLGWYVLSISTGCAKTLCTPVCVDYLINISIYTHTPLSGQFPQPAPGKNLSGFEQCRHLQHKLATNLAHWLRGRNYILDESMQQNRIA